MKTIEISEEETKLMIVYLSRERISNERNLKELHEYFNPGEMQTKLRIMLEDENKTINNIVKKII